MTLNYYKQQLKETATALAKSGKEILAVDKSTKAIGKRLASINIVNTEENRKIYRDLLFTTEGLEEFISGAILFKETLFQDYTDGDSMVKNFRN